MDNYEYCIGIMSGTSLDGIDVALCKIKGYGLDTDIKLISFKTYHYSDDVLNDIKKSLDLKISNSQLLCSLNFKLGLEYANAVKSLLKSENIDCSKIKFIANHGQTIYHQPQNNGNFVKSSLQLGDSATIAYQCKTTVVSNFRAGDIAAAGDGAPLVPYVDYILYRDDKKSRALHNLGGISNMTILPKSCDIEDIIAFDTGPANMMINRAMEQLFNCGYDKDGNIASQGNLIIKMLNELLDNQYFKQHPPKSTGRELFGTEHTDCIIDKYKKFKKEDIIHTITIFTAQSIVNAYKDFVFDKYKIDEIIFTGGGAYNIFLIKTIKQMFNNEVNIKTLEDTGGNSDAKEAIAFAILGNETLHKNYNNAPSATGASNKVILGQINYH